MRLNIYKYVAPFVAVTGLLVASAQAMAETLLPPGGTVTPPPTAGIGAGSTMVADTGTVNWTSATGSDAGTLREQVFKDPTNPNGANDLDFVYQVTVSKGHISTLSGSFYTGFTTFVSQTQTGPLGAGTDASSQASRASDGSIVNFHFAPSIPASGVFPGSSWELIVFTNATIFGQGNIGLVDSGTFTDQNAFAPASQVPEPASLVLLTSCMLGLGGSYLWRRRQGTPAAE